MYSAFSFLAMNIHLTLEGDRLSEDARSNMADSDVGGIEGLYSVRTAGYLHTSILYHDVVWACVRRNSTYLYKYDRYSL